uniref:receptor protein-tyrosine kinase n=1 Tax=Caenorhabditis japonica TaxID=281687 RepID=A0A8R1HZ52_CAEJA
MILRILLTLLILTYSPGLAQELTQGCTRINRDTIGCDSILSYNGTIKNLVVQDCSDLGMLDENEVQEIGPWSSVNTVTFNCTVEEFPWNFASIFPNIKYINLPNCNLTTLSWQKVYTETLRVLDVSQCPMECSCENQWMRTDGAFERVKEPYTLRKCLVDCDMGSIKLNQTMIIGNKGENVTIHLDIRDRFLNRSIEKPYFEWAYAKNQHNYEEKISLTSAELEITNLSRADIGLIGVRCWHCVNYLTSKVELRVNLPVKVEFVEKTRGDTDLLVVQGYPIENLTLSIAQLQSNQTQLNILDVENDSVYFSSLIVRPEKRSIFYQRTYRIFTKDTAEGDHLSGDLRFEVCTFGSCDSVEKHVSHLGTANLDGIIIKPNYNDIFFVVGTMLLITLLLISVILIYYQKALRSFIREKITSFRKRISWAQELQSRRASHETEETLLRLEERSSLASDYANMTIPFIEMGLIKIHEKIGSGQFGEVYCASWEKTGERSLAVKALKQFDHELEKEARTIFRLDHPNIVKMYGMSRDTKNLLLVFEHMNLGNLKQYLSERKPNPEYVQWPPVLTDGDAKKVCCEYIPWLTPLEVKKISFEIVKGVKYLVEQQVVHRDLAARNILVSGANDRGCRTAADRPPIKVKISDFGMSRRLYSHQDYYTMDHSGAVPVRWLSPEAIVESKFTFSSDIWALGVTMWEIYAYGGTPFDGLSNHEVYNYTMSGVRPRYPLNCPKEMYDLMNECWIHEPKERPTVTQLFANPCFDEVRHLTVQNDDRPASSNVSNGSPAGTSFTFPASESLMPKSGYFGRSSSSQTPLLNAIQQEDVPMLVSA